MSDTVTAAPERGAIATDVHDFLLGIAQDSTTRWVSVCDRFLDMQRQKILLGNPTAKEAADFKDGLKLMLRFTRFMHAEVADPDYPVRTAARDVEARLRQLEESWRMNYEPMPEAEAAQIAREHFAEDTLAQSLFPEAFAK